jgi:phosphatidate cytidylyltransferase
VNFEALTERVVETLSKPLQGRSELQKRVLTAIVGVALLLMLILLMGRWGIYILIAAVALGMMHEFASIAFRLPDKQEKRYAMLFLTWMLILSDLIGLRGQFEGLSVAFIFLSAHFLVTAKRYTDPADFGGHFRELMFAIFGLVYIPGLLLFLPRLHDFQYGPQWTIAFLLIVWVSDTAAYFAGKKYGRRKLYPEISPKKTVEGAMGGIIGASVMILIFKLTFFREMNWFAVILVPPVVAAFSQVGDLLESFLKRAFDRKDSGSILPGHGGFLDRFDGVVFGLPVMYAGIRLFG